MSSGGKSAKAISVEALSKNFGSKQALSGVTFSVPYGAIFGFLGPNGAGKTTTIRCLMDFIRPDSGSIKILGQDAQINSAILKQSIGYLSSDSQFYPDWTADDHIKFFESIKGRSPTRNKLVKRLDLDTRTKVKALSSGNKQKLAIVLCFVGNPELIIMDEPTRGLDPLLQNELYKILAEFVSGNKTVFLSSHNLGEVERICDSVVLIKDGVIVEEKTMASIRDMKVHVVNATTTRSFDVSKLRSFSNVEVISNYGGKTITLKVKGDLNQVLADLTKHDLSDISINHLSLEDVFLEQYRS